MDSTRAVKGLLVGAALFFGSVVTLGVITAPDDAAGVPPPRPAVSGYSHDDLQQAADMTQQMSAPNANTGSPVHANDDELVRSLNVAGYVQAVEQHQADIDRMLARGTP